MKILIAAESFFPRSNGVTNSVMKAAKFLRSTGHEVLILAQGDGPNFVEGQEVIRVPALSLHKYVTADFPVVSQKRLRQTISDFAPDVIHLASPFFLGDQVLNVATDLNIPVVAIYQTDVSGFAGFYKLNIFRTYGDMKIRKIHSRASLNLAPSSASEEYLRSLGVSKIKRWTRGVDLEAFNPKWRSTQLRATFGNRPVIGYVGRLAPEKQVAKLAALADLDATLVIIGDGPSKKELEKALPNAIFLGQLHGEALSKSMASLDILVTTGEHETFCQVIQEGMASKLAVVAPKAGGPIDLINNGVDGLLVEPGNLSELRSAVSLLISDVSLREKLATTAFNKVADKSWDNICDQLVRHYQDLINENQERYVS
jgi:phosphatidylinositol alpha 1,6-mannosyltransferase